MNTITYLTDWSTTIKQMAKIKANTIMISSTCICYLGLFYLIPGLHTESIALVNSAINEASPKSDEQIQEELIIISF